MAAEHGVGTLIVGAGQAGVQLAVSLRSKGYQGPITLIGAERHPPYQRPPLSKGVLAGDREPHGLALRAPGYFEGADIRLVCGERVTSVELPSDWPAGPGEAHTDAGRHISFDRLALTVGGSPRRLSAPGDWLDGIFYLREIDDALRLRGRLDPGSRVVVVGGGFVGLEVAAVAAARGADVTILEAADRLLARSVAPVLSDFLRTAHERRGSQVRLSAAGVAFKGSNGRVEAVVLADGTEVPADVVVVGIGLVPHVDLARSLGLACSEDGIVVDERGRTSRERVVAAGDCTLSPHPYGDGRVRLESVQNAVDQAKVAADALLDGHNAARVVPWFWSDQGDLKIQIAGLSQGHDEWVVRGAPADESFSVLYYRLGQLIAVDCINAPRDYLAVRKALASAANVPVDRATDMDTALKDLLVSPGAPVGSCDGTATVCR